MAQVRRIPSLSTGSSLSLDRPQAAKVLRNTYALLSLTILFAAGIAALAVANSWPAPGLVITLVGYFGLLFAVHKLQNSGWALPAVFALTGFMGYTLGPLLSRTLELPGGAGTIVAALAATGATFVALSAYVLTTRRDFSFMGGFLFAGMVIAIVLALVAYFFTMPALALAVSAMVALLSVGLILFETSRIVNGGETNYVLATVGLFVSAFNLFTSLLSLFGIGGND
ncbi:MULTISPECIES: Bax inhibitor-1/YccA family protein [Hydrogenophaga]|jgi:modulator of FtsH protease|uniref:Modulator of FtsH protease YccA n=1 Tax=Hydrogenophaga pseudoflava TaxID=47421 RepID=A0A4P6WVM4_HYDPS|nr:MULTISPECIES: Bax inhibitor-1/YccA family protein [Hydrogenophaga]OPF62984.1 BAX inhibitor protein [Hydrogenophaga sp. H7]QBM26285.1 Modulator of FtsH protease YccA [Hydrogenophaga pseudoflava]